MSLLHFSPPPTPILPPNTHKHRQDIASSRQRYVFGDSQLARLNGLLSQYEGTHNYHNYTVSGTPGHTSPALTGQGQGQGVVIRVFGAAGVGSCTVRATHIRPGGAGAGVGSHCHGVRGW